jgi:hypothetical protein
MNERPVGLMAPVRAVAASTPGTVPSLASPTLSCPGASAGIRVAAALPTCAPPLAQPAQAIRKRRSRPSARAMPGRGFLACFKRTAAPPVIYRGVLANAFTVAGKGGLHQ